MRCISVPEVPTIGTYARSVITSSERTEDSAAGCTKKLEERGSGSHSDCLQVFQPSVPPGTESRKNGTESGKSGTETGRTGTGRDGTDLEQQEGVQMSIFDYPEYLSGRERT